MFKLGFKKNTPSVKTQPFPSNAPQIQIIIIRPPSAGGRDANRIHERDLAAAASIPRGRHEYAINVTREDFNVYQKIYIIMRKLRQR